MKLMKRYLSFGLLILIAIGTMYLILNGLPETTVGKKVIPFDKIGSQIIQPAGKPANAVYLSPIHLLFIQLIVILLLSRFCGYFFKKIGQPAVIGEILAGILLGPSLVGNLFPGFQKIFFPIESIQSLYLISQIGLVLFMFIIGMELDLEKVKQKADSALFTSISGIVFSFFLGVILSRFLFVQFAPQGVHFTSFSLFLGIAMSITAFPILARIIQERGIMNTHLGVMAVTCAAMDDITAWCLFALVIAAIKADGLWGGIITTSLTLLFTIGMLFIVRPILHKVSKIYASREILGRGVMTYILIFLLVASFFTETIGIHSLFGAFLAGVIMPTDTKFRNIITDRLESISTILLLPIFFALTGLRTDLHLLFSPSNWWAVLAVIGVAIAGKFGGCTLASRVSGLSWKDSISLGILMNTRGLMELIVLNIGYDLGILSAEIFSILVFMALFTTFLTGPGLTLVDWIRNMRIHSRRKKEIVLAEGNASHFLIAFGPSVAGEALLKASAEFIDQKRGDTLTALHLTPSGEFTLLGEGYDRHKIFDPIVNLSIELGIPIRTVHEVSTDPPRDIAKYTQDHGIDCLFLGAAKTILGENIAGGKVGEIVKNIGCTCIIVSDSGKKYQSGLGIVVPSTPETEKMKEKWKISGNRKETQFFSTEKMDWLQEQFKKSTMIQEADRLLLSLEQWNEHRHNLEGKWNEEGKTFLVVCNPENKTAVN